MIRLTRVDLPTFGRPMTATTGSGPRGAVGVEGVVAALEQRPVLGAQLEVLEPGPQRALDGGVVDGAVEIGAPSSVGRAVSSVTVSSNRERR